MDISDLATLGYWNSLAGTHLPEVVMVLTAAVVTLADRYVRRLVNRLTSSWHKILRFGAFLVVCSAGYAGLALGVAWALRSGLTLEGGVYMAPAAAGLVVLVALEAQRQRQT